MSWKHDEMHAIHWRLFEARWKMLITSRWIYNYVSIHKMHAYMRATEQKFFHQKAKRLCAHMRAKFRNSWQHWNLTLPLFYSTSLFEQIVILIVCTAEYLILIRQKFHSAFSMVINTQHVIEFSMKKLARKFLKITTKNFSAGLNMYIYMIAKWPQVRAKFFFRCALKLIFFSRN